MIYISTVLNNYLSKDIEVYLYKLNIDLRWNKLTTLIFILSHVFNGDYRTYTVKFSHMKISHDIK